LRSQGPDAWAFVAHGWNGGDGGALARGTDLFPDLRRRRAPAAVPGCALDAPQSQFDVDAVAERP
jgi:hypothetical protein